jgi:hypothetical protein
VRTGAAVMKLVSMGYHFEIVGEKVRYEWQGLGDPNAGQVAPLLDLVRKNKDAVRYFLSSFCPRCGGAFFGTFAGMSRCMGCYWEDQARLYPDMARGKH